MNVIPAIIPTSEEHLASSIAKLEGCAASFQIDFVDGQYAGHPSWPWNGDENFAHVATYLKSVSTTHALEVDLMVQQPDRYVPECVVAGVSRLVIHVGSTEVLADVLAMKGVAQIGLAFTNDTPLDALHAHRDAINFVQCMGIAKIGAQGEPFDERVLARIREIKEYYPDLEVSIDGHVTAFTLPLLKHAGATRFVAGSSVFAAPDPVRAYEELVALARA